MEDPEREARALVEAVESLPRAVQGCLLGLTSLSDKEAALLHEGLRGGSQAVDALSRQLLERWGELTVQERVAALLAIAAAVQSR